MIIAIATGTSVLLADPADGTAIRVLVGLSSWVTAMAFTPDSTRLATGTEDGTARIWDAYRLRTHDPGDIDRPHRDDY